MAYFPPSASPSSSSLRPGSLVRHTHTHPAHGRQDRHGLVTKVHEPAIVGTDTSDPEHPTDIVRAHADVAWFGLDGLTTVPVDELDPID